MPDPTPLVRMTRRVTFSAGHRYWIPALSEAENRARFGRWASPYNHGHNYVLEVTVEGRVDPRTGMVVNIKRVDDVLRAGVVQEFDGRSINDEVAAFYSRPSTLENLMLYIRDRLGDLPAEGELVGIRLEEMPGLYGEVCKMNDGNWQVSVTRSYEFAASHRLNVPSLSLKENLDLFGKCNNPTGHGHNYVLEVTVSGTPDADTGMLVDIEALDRVVNERVVDRYDHHNLNEDLPEYRDGVTTSEIVASTIFRTLEGHLPAKLSRIRLYETARNLFEVTAS
jgi:6-pyruvoyltetrahydropterin/6-carboxytetrahydropterin synthase